MSTTEVRTRKCIICDVRPALNGNPYCHRCQQVISAERKKRQSIKPDMFLVYQGNVVGMFRQRGGTFTSKLLGCSAKKLPKARTLILDNYLEGYTRSQIKKMKSLVKQLTNV